MRFDCPASILPIDQVKGFSPFVDGLLVRNSKPSGTVSTTTTSGIAAAPVLNTSIVYVQESNTKARSGAFLVMRTADATRVRVVWPCSNPTLAVLSRSPMPSACSTIVITRCSPGFIEPNNQTSSWPSTSGFGSALTNFAWAGIGLRTRTRCAIADETLSTWILKIASPPGETAAGTRTRTVTTGAGGSCGLYVP